MIRYRLSFFLFSLVSLAVSQSVEEVPCAHYGRECGPLGALCDCTPDKDNSYNCIEQNRKCKCDAENGMYLSDELPEATTGTELKLFISNNELNP